MKNKMTAALFALFLGGLGVHKFYLDKKIEGIFYLLFCWTLIPSLLSILDFLVLLVMNNERFNELYNQKEINKEKEEHKINRDLQKEYNAYIKYTKETDLQKIESGNWNEGSYNKILQELIKDYRYLINVPGNEFKKDPRLKDFKIKQEILNKINVSDGYTEIKYFDYLSTFL